MYIAFIAVKPLCQTRDGNREPSFTAKCEIPNLQAPRTKRGMETGPVYRWDVLFSESDGVLKAVRAGNRLLQWHHDRYIFLSTGTYEMNVDMYKYMCMCVCVCVCV